MINYKRLVSAQTYYTGCGYQNIETPWVVDPVIDDITRPESKQPYSIESQRLVASGEQSFLQLRHNGKLLDGCYQTITPCFRNEREDAIHQKMFMKLELIRIGTFVTTEERQYAINLMIMHARMFFESQNISVVVEKTGENSWDINCAKTGIELGSYGHRAHSLIGEWIYGTGLAEPRMDYVINHQLP